MKYTNRCEIVKGIGFEMVWSDHWTGGVGLTILGKF
jgi:hypothetical protein